MSLDLDFELLWGYAVQIVNMLWPVVAIIAGFGLGGAILSFIASKLRNVF